MVEKTAPRWSPGTRGHRPRRSPRRDRPESRRTRRPRRRPRASRPRYRERDGRCVLAFGMAASARAVRLRLLANRRTDRNPTSAMAPSSSGAVLRQLPGPSAWPAHCRWQSATSVPMPANYRRRTRGVVSRQRRARSRTPGVADEIELLGSEQGRPAARRPGSRRLAVERASCGASDWPCPGRRGR